MIDGTYLNDTLHRLFVSASAKEYSGTILSTEDPDYFSSYFNIETDMPIENLMNQSFSSLKKILRDHIKLEIL